MDNKKNTREKVGSYDSDDLNSVARSQLRRRFDVPPTTATPAATKPDLSSRKTTRPKAPPEIAERSSRPTIPTPPPILALGCVPRRLVDAQEMMKLPLDHRAAFVLTHVDGKTNIRTLIDVTSMPPDELIALLERLLELGAIRIV